MKTLIALLCAAALGLSGCATFQQNLTPSQVQADVTALGAIAKPYTTLEVQHNLYVFATQVETTGNIAVLLNLLPQTGNPNVDKFIADVARYATLGQPYAHAVSQGILANYPQ